MYKGINNKGNLNLKDVKLAQTRCQKLSISTTDNKGNLNLKDVQLAQTRCQKLSISTTHRL